ncbi:MAG: c-type cytochrome, partial [Bryobacteraceae bacterium]
MKWAGLLAAAVLVAQPPESLFVAHCAPCHGLKGEGGKGPSLNVPRLPRAPNDLELVGMILGGIGGTEMPPSRMTLAEARSLAEYVRGLGRHATAPVAGDAARGQSLYAGKGGCARCHMIGGQGGRMGPDLSDAGARRGAVYLRTSLVRPEADIPDNFAFYRRMISIPDNFLQVRVVTSGGQRITGVRLNEDPFTIQIRDYEDRFHSFVKSELKELHKDWGRSPMPSYEKTLS